MLFYLYVFIHFFSFGAMPEALAGDEPRLALIDRISEIDKYAQTISGKFDNKCDARQAPMRKEIAEALDANMPAIVDLLKVTNQENYRSVKIGPFLFREEITQEIIVPGYAEEIFSWDQIYKTFQEIKSNPADRRWIKLNFHAQYLMALDTDRKVDHLPNYYQGAERDYPIVIGAITECLAAPSCSLLPDSVNSNVLFDKAYFSDVNSYLKKYQPDFSERRKWLDGFLSNLKEDFQNRYGFLPNKTILRKSPTEIILPLDPGPFKGLEDLLAQHIESAWASERLKLKILWTSRAEQPDVFIIKYDDAPGSNSYVSWRRKEIHFAINARIATIGHEIGHVLGFKDRYYFHWSEKDCGYLDQSDPSETMSGYANTPSAMSEKDFEELDRQYPERI